MITGFRRAVVKACCLPAVPSAMRDFGHQTRPLSSEPIPLMVPPVSPMNPPCFQGVRRSQARSSGNDVFTTRVPRRFYSTPPPADASPKRTKKVTVLDIRRKYKKGQRITMLTGYDFPTAELIDSEGIDMILVGDSVGMVVHGHQSTVPVTVDEMVSHCAAVKRGAKSAFLVGDMPFGSYEIDEKEAAANALRIIKEGGMDAVKLEGGKRMVPAIKAIVNAGILVVGHIGLTPQSASAMGGFRVQGKSASAAKALLEDAKALQEAGVMSMVIEGVPPEVAQYVTENISVPTIGIGAGKETSGQVLVFHDMVGLNPRTTPKFCKKYCDVSESIRRAIQQFKQEVASGTFPAEEHCYLMPEAEREKLQHLLGPLKPLINEKVKESIVGSVPTPPLKKSDNRLRIAIVGGGAMGSFVAGMLGRTGVNSIWMVSAWTDHIKTINKTGLRLDGLEGSAASLIPTIRATQDVDEIIAEDGPMDLVVVLVKSPNTAIAAQKAARLVKPDGMILTLQNGIGNREVILKEFNFPEQVIQGVTAHGALMMGSGHVQHTGIGNTTLALPTTNLEVKERVERIAKMLTLSGIETGVEDPGRMESVVWGKLIINAGINPLSALFRVRNGVLAENKVCRDLLAQTVAEAANVAITKGISLPFTMDPIEAALEVARKTAQNQSSMLCDVLRGVETEIGSINGHVVREGQGLGVCVDMNQNLVSMVQKLQPIC